MTAHYLSLIICHKKVTTTSTLKRVLRKNEGWMSVASTDK